MSENLSPLGQRVLIKAADSTTSQGGILLVNSNRSNRGSVIAIGPKVTEVEVGNEVLFQLPLLQEQEGDIRYILVDEENLLAVVKTK